MAAGVGSDPQRQFQCKQTSEEPALSGVIQQIATSLAQCRCDARAKRYR